MTSPPSDAKPKHLEPSALGTKEYWDTLYTAELTNHAANPADEGTVWFDDSDAQDKVIAYLDELLLETGGDDGPRGAEQQRQQQRGWDKRSAAVLDLGCGNGALLFALRDAGWCGRLLGVDYSPLSIALARQVGEARAAAAAAAAVVEDEEEDQDNDDGREEEAVEDSRQRDTDTARRVSNVDFQVWDVLHGALDTASVPAENEWDLVLDKGTFDAVSLSDERDGRGRRVCEGYRTRVLRLLRPGGLFLVTSCNWTEEELRAWFAGARDEAGDLRPVGRIAYRSFSFGGVKGQTISTVCFVKEV